MRSSIHLLLLAASLGLATDSADCDVFCINSYNSANPNPCPSASVLADITDPCNCSWAFHAVLCYSSVCLGLTQVYYASSAWNDICSGNSPSTNAAMPTSASDISPSSTATAAAQSTGTDTLASATAAATGMVAGTGTTGGTRSSAGTAGSAAPAATSKAWGERSLVLPAGGAVAAVLGLAIFL